MKSIHFDNYGTHEWLAVGSNMRHREEGPAIIFSDGHKSWWYKGKKINCSSQEEFERLVKLKAFW